MRIAIYVAALFLLELARARLTVVWGLVKTECQDEELQKDKKEMPAKDPNKKPLPLRTTKLCWQVLHLDLWLLLSCINICALFFSFLVAR